MPDTPSHPVVLFDGPCGLCQRSVRFLLRQEKKPELRFASIQSKAGQRLLKEHALPLEATEMVFVEDGKAYAGSEAAFEISKYLKFPLRAVRVFRYLPRFLHQGVYRWVARNRYKWFGKDESCALPAPEQAERFL